MLFWALKEAYAYVYHQDHYIMEKNLIKSRSGDEEDKNDTFGERRKHNTKRMPCQKKEANDKYRRVDQEIVNFELSEIFNELANAMFEKSEMSVSIDLARQNTFKNVLRRSS